MQSRIHAVHQQTGILDAAGLALLTELAGNVAYAIDHLDREERLHRLSYYDALTDSRTDARFSSGSRSTC